MLQRDHAVDSRCLGRSMVSAGAGWQHLMADGTGQHRGGGDRHCPEHTDRLMAPVRDEGPGADVASGGSWRRHESHLGHGGSRHVTESHQKARGHAHLLEPGPQAAVGLEGGAVLVTGRAQVAGPHHHRRHPVVYEGAAQPRDGVDESAGGQQGAAGTARNVFEVEPHRGRRAGHAVDGGGARVVGHAASQSEGSGRHRSGVDHVDAHSRLGPARRDQAPLHRERPDAGQHVAAVLGVADEGLVHGGLKEQVVHVGARLGCRTDHRHFGG